MLDDDAIFETCTLLRAHTFFRDNLWHSLKKHMPKRTCFVKKQSQKQSDFTGPSKSLFWWHQGVRKVQPCVAGGPRYSRQIAIRVGILFKNSWCKVEHATCGEPSKRAILPTRKCWSRGFKCQNYCQKWVHFPKQYGPHCRMANVATQNVTRVHTCARHSVTTCLSQSRSKNTMFAKRATVGHVVRLRLQLPLRYARPSNSAIFPKR